MDRPEQLAIKCAGLSYYNPVIRDLMDKYLCLCFSTLLSDEMGCRDVVGVIMRLLLDISVPVLRNYDNKSEKSIIIPEGYRWSDVTKWVSEGKKELIVMKDGTVFVDGMRVLGNCRDAAMFGDGVLGLTIDGKIISSRGNHLMGTYTHMNKNMSSFQMYRICITGASGVYYWNGGRGEFMQRICDETCVLGAYINEKNSVYVKDQQCDITWCNKFYRVDTGDNKCIDVVIMKRYVVLLLSCGELLIWHPVNTEKWAGGSIIGIAKVGSRVIFMDRLFNTYRIDEHGFIFGYKWWLKKRTSVVY